MNWTSIIVGSEQWTYLDVGCRAMWMPVDSEIRSDYEGFSEEFRDYFIPFIQEKWPGAILLEDSRGRKFSYGQVEEEFFNWMKWMIPGRISPYDMMLKIGYPVKDIHAIYVDVLFLITKDASGTYDPETTYSRRWSPNHKGIFIY